MPSKTRINCRRKFQHHPTSIDELSIILKQASDLSKRDLKKLSWRDQAQLPSGILKDVKRSKSKPANWKSSSLKRQDGRSNEGNQPTLTSAIRELSSSLPELRSGIEPYYDNLLDEIKFKIGSITYEMNDVGEWKTNVKNDELKDELSKIQTSNKKRFEENNLLRVKNELLLDMVVVKIFFKT